MKKNTKKSLKVVIVLLCLSLLVYFFFPKPICSLNDLEKRAVWVSYQDLSKISFENKKAFQKDFQDMINNAKKYQCNTLIVHVRSFMDALYPSALFPVSQIMTNQKTLSFDPLKEMIELTHQEGLSFEAWINPYRISLNEKTYQQFVETSTKRSWLNDSRFTIHYGTYQYILNPASQQVREYIVDGVKEIVSYYDVDGIHFDDYFYVDGTHGKTTQQQRMDHVNELIFDVYQEIKKINDGVTFGISPQGNIENCYHGGADIETWLKEDGYIDYLMPQIYWSDQYGLDGKTEMFSERVKVFAKLKRNKNIKLYAGLALYKARNENDSDPGWTMSNQNISDQIQKLYEEGYDGYSLFDYSSMMNQGQKEMDEVLRHHP